jgi:hypothetical protein
VLIEFAQGLFSEVRQAEFSDVVADAVGSLLVLAMVAGWHIVRRGRPGRNRR